MRIVLDSAWATLESKIKKADWTNTMRIVIYTKTIQSKYMDIILKWEYIKLRIKAAEGGRSTSYREHTANFASSTNSTQLTAASQNYVRFVETKILDSD